MPLFAPPLFSRPSRPLTLACPTRASQGRAAYSCLFFWRPPRSSSPHVRLVRLFNSTHTIDPHAPLMLTRHGTSGGTTRVGWRERKGPGTTRIGRHYYQAAQTDRATHKLRMYMCVKAEYRGGRAVNTGDGHGETPQKHRTAGPPKRAALPPGHAPATPSVCAAGAGERRRAA